MTRRVATRRPAPNGFIVVAALWIVVGLAVLATIYSVHVRNSLAVFGMTGERLQAETLVTAGVELAAYQLIARPGAPAKSPSSTQANAPAQAQSTTPSPTQPILQAAALPASGRYDFRLGSAIIRTEFRTEAARIDLNAAPKELIAGLFAALGAQPLAAQDYAEHIVAWRTPRRADTGSDEASLYRAAGRAYGPREAAFPHVEELWLVLGLPPELVARALPFVTVYSGQAGINLAEAAPQVLASLPGMTSEMLHAVLAQRGGLADDAQEVSRLLGPGARYVTDDVGLTFRITVEAQFDVGRSRRCEIVILLSEQDSEPYRVLSWRDLDDAPGDAGR